MNNGSKNQSNFFPWNHAKADYIFVYLSGKKPDTYFPIMTTMVTFNLTIAIISNIIRK